MMEFRFKCDECGQEVDSVKPAAHSAKLVCDRCAKEPEPLPPIPSPEDAEDLL